MRRNVTPFELIWGAAPGPRFDAPIMSAPGSARQAWGCCPTRFTAPRKVPRNSPPRSALHCETRALGAQVHWRDVDRTKNDLRRSRHQGQRRHRRVAQRRAGAARDRAPPGRRRGGRHRRPRSASACCASIATPPAATSTNYRPENSNRTSRPNRPRDANWSKKPRSAPRTGSRSARISVRPACSPKSFTCTWRRTWRPRPPAPEPDEVFQVEWWPLATAVEKAQQRRIDRCEDHHRNSASRSTPENCVKRLTS